MPQTQSVRPIGLSRFVIRLRRSGTIALLSLSLTGCATGLFDGVDALGPTVGEINKMPEQQASAVLANTTIMTFDPGLTWCTFTGKYPSCQTAPGHGTQIEYFDESGRAFLWYPGNSRAVPSSWNLRRSESNMRYQICFLYPSNSYNPLTHTRGGSPECRDLADFAKNIKDARKGDIFDLGTGRIPYKLSSASASFDELLEQRDKR